MKDTFHLETITVKVNYEPVKVCVMDYVTAKTKDLQEYGYCSVTEEEILNSVWKVVNKETNLNVIDLFVEGDIVLDEKEIN